MPYDFDLDYVFETIENLLSKKYFSDIDVIYIGQFEEFEKNDFNAMYKDNALYVSSTQDTENDMVDDVVHEVAHAVEEKFKEVFEKYLSVSRAEANLSR